MDAKGHGELGVEVRVDSSEVGDLREKFFFLQEKKKTLFVFSESLLFGSSRSRYFSRREREEKNETSLLVSKMGDGALAAAGAADGVLARAASAAAAVALLDDGRGDEDVGGDDARGDGDKVRVVVGLDGVDELLEFGAVQLVLAHGDDVDGDVVLAELLAGPHERLHVRLDGRAHEEHDALRPVLVPSVLERQLRHLNALHEVELAGLESDAKSKREDVSLESAGRHKNSSLKKRCFTRSAAAKIEKILHFSLSLKGSGGGRARQVDESHTAPSTLSLSLSRVDREPRCVRLFQKSVPGK